MNIPVLTPPGGPDELGGLMLDAMANAIIALRNILIYADVPPEVVRGWTRQVVGTFNARTTPARTQVCAMLESARTLLLITDPTTNSKDDANVHENKSGQRKD